MYMYNIYIYIYTYMCVYIYIYIYNTPEALYIPEPRSALLLKHTRSSRMPTSQYSNPTYPKKQPDLRLQCEALNLPALS